MTTHQGQIDAKGKRFAIIVSRWNEEITGKLLDTALEEFKRHGNTDVEVFHVPGTWEIPVVASKVVCRPAENRPHAIVALGCILQGATPHAQLLNREVSSSLMRLQSSSGVPITWGVLAADSEELAMDRIHRSNEAVLAAIEMANLLEQV